MSSRHYKNSSNRNQHHHHSNNFFHGNTSMEASTNMSGMSMSMDMDTTSGSGGTITHGDQSLIFHQSMMTSAEGNSTVGGNANSNANANGGSSIGKKLLSNLGPTPSNTNVNSKNNRESNMNLESRLTDSWDIEDARWALRKAVQSLSQRGLKLASKWAAEQLVGLAPTAPPSTKTFDFRGKVDDTPAAGGAGSISADGGDSDLELYAKSIMDLGEYHRAAAILSTNSASSSFEHNAVSSSSSTLGMSGRNIGKANRKNGGDLGVQPPRKNLSSYGIYLRAYALYMAGERRKEEEVLELRDPLERTTVTNSYLPQLASELQSINSSNGLDAFGLYIYGIVLKEMQKSPTSNPQRSHQHNRSSLDSPSAQSILIQSLIQYPYNWSAWLDLGEICIMDPSIHPEVEALLKPISSHWMYHFFCVHLFLENQANENAIMVIEKLVHGTTEDFNGNNGFFVSSPYLQSQLAVAHYNMRDFDTAQTHFTMSSERDPYRLDQMDVYSNILYVKEDKVALSSLAHRAVKLDKYRPETCCIVGNYYSLKTQHEKAVQYFQRALKLDRTYLSAWTLMGHEFLEMKNTAAAIEAYRRAVDINANDYRAWYGLGQTYEIMNMLLYALFYYQKAVELRPYDARMWCAMGGCYLGLERRSDAKRSYERAVANHDAEGIATKQLATLYREDGESEKAARCYLKHLELRFQTQLNQSSLSSEGATIQVVISSVNVDEPEAEALLNLATYHLDHDKFEMASLCCSRLLDYPGPEKEEAKALLREIRSKIDKSQGKKRGIPNESFEFSP